MGTSRVRGLMDYIGPSGGASIPDGEYSLDASGIVHIYSRYNDLQLQSHDGNTTVSGQNIYLHASGNIIAQCHNIFQVGVSNFEDIYTPISVLSYSRGDSGLKTENGDIILRSLRNGDNNNFNGIRIKSPPTGTIEIATVNGAYILHIGSFDDPFPAYSGLADFNTNSGFIGANCSGIRSGQNIHIESIGDTDGGTSLYLNAKGDSHLSADNNVYIHAPNIEFLVPNGNRPTVNSSGILLIGDIVNARFYGAISGDQNTSTSDTDILWNGTLKSNVTHTNGTAKIYLPKVGIYFISTFLTTDYKIGGQRMVASLYHYNGTSTTALVQRPSNTSHGIRNAINVAYTLQTVTVNDYIYLRARVTAAEAGSVWKQNLCGINVVKI